MKEAFGCADNDFVLFYVNYSLMYYSVDLETLIRAFKQRIEILRYVSLEYARKNH